MKRAMTAGAESFVRAGRLPLLGGARGAALLTAHAPPGGADSGRRDEPPAMSSDWKQTTRIDRKGWSCSNLWAFHSGMAAARRYFRRAGVLPFTGVGFASAAGMTTLVRPSVTLLPSLKSTR